ncbi:MAG: Sensor histidine kinase TodS [Bacteroidetes bacterium ADurb.Bin174]|nr:MAG: Sensor histidine kinase TodS [Bacteroidetes bacterium ADurb.Bin174]
MNFSGQYPFANNELMTSLRHIICSFVFMSTTLVVASSYNGQYQIEFPRPLSVVDGLASNEITCMLQDSKGFMWFGTRNGLSRYDGYVFKSYKSNYLNPSYFTNNNINCIAEDKDNQLWVGTRIGLNKIDLRTGKVIQFNDSILNGVLINSIVISDNNTTYLGTSNGIYIYDQEKNVFRPLIADAKGIKLRSNYIKTLFIDSKNFLWIGAWETGCEVYNLNTNLFVDYSYLQDKSSLVINNIFEDDRHSIWLSTWDRNGVIRIENPHQPSIHRITTFFPQKYENSTVLPVVYGVCQDKNKGNILFATANGLQILKQTYQYENLVQLNNTNSIKISGDEIHSMFADRSGLIWYSVFGVGLNALSSNNAQFEQFNLTNLFESDNLFPSISGIFEDETGTVWLGIKSLGLALFDRNERKITLHNNHPILRKISEKANSFYSFHKTKLTNELWLGSRYDGLYSVRFIDGKISSISHLYIPDIDMRNQGIKDMVEVNGTIWLATTRGLFTARWNGVNEYLFVNMGMIQQKFNEKEINALIVDNVGTLWVGTHNEGLFAIRFKDDNKVIIDEYSHSNKRLNNNEVLCLLQDFRNRIWVGTKGGGLSLLDTMENRFNIIDNMNLLPDDAIYSMEEDNWGNLWLATGNGLVNYNEDHAKNQKICIFSGKEGVKINSYNPNAVYKNKNNELFFGGNNGFILFTPEQEQQKSFSPQPVICGLNINNTSFDVIPDDKKVNITETDIPYTNEIELSHKQNNIIIEFSALLYENIPALKYAYKMEGVDDEWVYVDSKKRFVNYNNLSKGEYNFKVKSCNSLGQWCDQPTSFIVKIKPAPWDSSIAYFIYFLLFIIIFYFTLRILSNRMRLKRMLAIEQIEREKSEEVTQAKLKFFTNISHEFFTPITIMKCTLDGFAKRYPNESKFVFTLNANMDRLVRLLEQIVEFRKVETGNLKLKISKVEIVSFVRELCDVHFKPLYSDNNISLHFESTIDELEAYVDADKLDKIIFNLLSNAFKYNKPNGSVHVKVDVEKRYNGNHLTVTISDTGYGMTDDVKQNLFKRFYEGSLSDFKIKSIGIGLSLTHDLVQFHKGEITVESQEGIGSTFTVSLPIDKEVYEEEQMYQAEKQANSNFNSLINESGNVSVSERQMKVLIVEDNMELLNSISDALDEEFIVYKATNGIIALELLEHTEVDVVVTDVIMPEMDGIEFSCEMKNRVEFSHIPILVLSAKHDVEHKIEGYNAGADAYITKPFEMSALIANIKSLVRNRKLLAKSFADEKGNVNVEKFTYNNTDKDFLEKVVEIIENNIFNAGFSTNDLYKAINMSQSTLYRKLQVLIGISPNELIRKIRIKTACRLLLEKRLNISEIAYDLGFSDPKYFSNVFKKEMGISPTAYIKQHRN